MPDKPSKASVLRRISSAVDELNAAVAAAQKIWPGAEYYVSEGRTLNLMKGPHHSGNEARDRRDNVVAHFNIDRIDTGMWSPHLNIHDTQPQDR